MLDRLDNFKCKICPFKYMCLEIYPHVACSSTHYTIIILHAYDGYVYFAMLRVCCCIHFNTRDRRSCMVHVVSVCMQCIFF